LDPTGALEILGDRAITATGIFSNIFSILLSLSYPSSGAVRQDISRGANMNQLFNARSDLLGFSCSTRSGAASAGLGLHRE
jgi:hypothetical protein